MDVNIIPEEGGGAPSPLPTAAAPPAEPATEPIRRRPADLTGLPLSALQQRIWYLCTAYSGDASPVLFHTWHLRGRLDVAAWARAVGTVVDHHESLRTRFPDRGGMPVQVIAPPGELEQEYLDLSDLPEPEREARARDVMFGRTHALLDLVHGPLVASCLVRLAPEHHLWCFTVHHLLADGTSLGIINREVRAAYESFVDATLPGPPRPPLGYGDFAVWQHQTHSVAEERDLLWWLDQLAGLSPLELRTDRPRPPEKNTRSGEVAGFVPAEVGRDLHALLRTQRCTLYMALLAALYTLLSEHSGQHDICVGTPVDGRTRVEMEPVVGLFANTLPMRGDLSGDPTFRELLTRTRSTVINALARQTVPFGRVVAALNLPVDKSRTQVFQVIFSMHSKVKTTPAEQHDEVAGLHIEPYPVGSPKILHDLVVDVWRPDPFALRVAFRYDTALFTHETATTMARRFETLLARAVERPDARLSELASRP
jgi:hypothetical protein